MLIEIALVEAKCCFLMSRSEVRLDAELSHDRGWRRSTGGNEIAKGDRGVVEIL